VGYTRREIPFSELVSGPVLWNGEKMRLTEASPKLFVDERPAQPVKPKRHYVRSARVHA